MRRAWRLRSLPLVGLSLGLVGGTGLEPAASSTQPIPEDEHDLLEPLETRPRNQSKHTRTRSVEPRCPPALNLHLYWPRPRSGPWICVSNGAAILSKPYPRSWRSSDLPRALLPRISDACGAGSQISARGKARPRDTPPFQDHPGSTSRAGTRTALTKETTSALRPQPTQSDHWIPAINKPMLRGTKKLYAHGLTFVVVTDNDAPVFLHGVHGRLIAQFEDENIGVTIVSDNHGYSPASPHQANPIPTPPSPTRVN
jgi:hypothetical protein